MSETPRRPSEARLDALRGEAARTGRVDGPGLKAVGGPMPSELMERPGYYGRPLLKPPVWTWEIPLYFFVGGLAGAAAVLAWAALLLGGGGAAGLVREALWIALGGALVSAVLLTMDLGRPVRFLYMLRVFKWRSPMSVGVWVLTSFGGFATLGVLGAELSARGLTPTFAAIVLQGGAWGAALAGSVVATYTGVLIGATAVPAWNLHRGTLPIHFGVAGLGSAGALLELLGHRLPALWAVGILAAGVETLVGMTVELSNHGAADRALREGRPGALLRGAGFLAGPVALVLRAVGLVPWAAAAFLLGAFTSRFGWMEAGRASAKDPEAALERYAR